MTNDHEVISAFLDDEPFDPQLLATALDDPTGRAMLIDLITLRQIVQPPHPVPVLKPTAPAWQFGWRGAVAAAVLLVVLAGGYLVGLRQAAPAVPAAPAATRVVQAIPFNPS